MNNLQIFKNSEFGQVRTVVIDGEPWFIGKDVAEALGYANPSKAVLIHVDEEDKTFTMLNIADSQNGNVLVGQSKTALINESGLYSLILSSKLPTAKTFKRWVTSEVLPSIRKTGTYSIVPTETDKLIKCAEIMAGCLSENRQYVLNIIRHIVPDVDSEPVETVGTEVIEIPISDNRGYKKPFNYNQFSNYLLEHDIKHHWLESKLGCSTGLVCRWTHGLSKPTEYHRIKLCEVLNLPIGYFDNSRRVRRIQQ